MAYTISAVVAEDTYIGRALIQSAVDSLKEKPEVTFCETLGELKDRSGQADIFVIDLGLPDSPVEQTLEEIPKFCEIAPVILYTAYDVPKEIEKLVLAVIHKDGSFDRIRFAAAIKLAMSKTTTKITDTGILKLAKHSAK